MFFGKRVKGILDWKVLGIIVLTLVVLTPTYVPRVSAATGNLTEWALPDSNSGPWGIAVDQSNKVWFTENVTNRLGRLDSVNSQIKEWAIPGGGNPKYIFLKPTGSGVSVYFTEYSTGKIGRFDNATNTFYEWTLHDTDSRPVGIYVDQDDHIWTTLSAKDTIAEIIPLSNIENDYQLPTNGQFVGPSVGSSVSTKQCGDHQSKLCPWGIYVQTVSTIGTPNKFVWFTESNNNAIGRLEINSNVLTTFKLSGATDYGPLDITLDASGNVLFTGSSSAANRISMIRNQSNTFADFFIPSSQSKPTSVEWDPVHNLAWFTENNGGKVTSLDTSAGVFALIPQTIVCKIAGSPPGVNAPNCDTFAGGNSGANFFGSLGVSLSQNSGFANTRTLTAIPSTLTSQGFGVFSEYVLSPTIAGPNSIVVDDNGGIWFSEQQSSGNRIGYLTITVVFDFGFSANTNLATVSRGQSATFTLNLNLINGNAQNVALSITPTVAGLTTSFNPTSGSLPFTSTLTLATTSQAPPGNYVFTITAKGGGVTKTLPVTLNVTPSTFTVSPSTASVHRGDAINFTIRSSLPLGTVGTLNITGHALLFGLPGRMLPVGLTASFNPIIQGNSTSTISIRASRDTTIGSYVLTLELRVDSSASQKTDVMLLVLPTSDEYWINAKPRSLIVSQAHPGESFITAPVLPLTDIIEGPTLQWFVFTSTNTSQLPMIDLNLRGNITGPPWVSNATLRVVVDQNVAVGNYTIGVQATWYSWTSLNQTRQILIPLTVLPSFIDDFMIMATSSAITIPQASYGKSKISVPNLSDKTIAANLTGYGPPGVSLAFSPNPVDLLPQGTTTSTLTITVDRSVPIGNYSLTIWANYGTIAHSTTISLRVTPAQCLIATATYGSELASEVQVLRQFRDNKVMRTYSGGQFMLAFNAWYYSFSPGIAAWIGGSETARGLMRAVLYPLIGALTISSSLFDLFSFDTEIAVLVAGISASSLLGAIYLTLPIIIVLRAAKRRMNRKALISILGIGLALALFGTLSNGTLELMQILTSVVVLESMLLAPSILTKGILHIVHD